MKKHNISFTSAELHHLNHMIVNYERMEMRQHPELRKALRKINKEYKRAMIFEETRLGGYPLQAMKYLPPVVPVG